MDAYKELSAEELEAVVGGSSCQLPDKEGCRIYQIQRGDTLSKIARIHHTTENYLLQINTTILDPNLLRVGDYIYVPE